MCVRVFKHAIIKQFRTFVTSQKCVKIDFDRCSTRMLSERERKRKNENEHQYERPATFPWLSNMSFINNKKECGVVLGIHNACIYRKVHEIFSCIRRCSIEFPVFCVLSTYFIVDFDVCMLLLLCACFNKDLAE